MSAEVEDPDQNRSMTALTYGDLSLVDLAERIHTSNLANLLALADHISELSRQHEIAHVSTIVEDDDRDERVGANG